MPLLPSSRHRVDFGDIFLDEDSEHLHLRNERMLNAPIIHTIGSSFEPGGSAGKMESEITLVTIG